MKKLIAALLLVPFTSLAVQQDLGKIAMASDLDETKQIVNTWEAFLDGSNVVFSITNYLSNTYLGTTPKLKILELRDGEYREIYDSWSDAHYTISNELSKFEKETLVNPTNGVVTIVSNTEVHIEAVYQELMDVKADKAWGKYTSVGEPAPSNTVTIVEPVTEFAGGTGFASVGLGTVCVLTSVGAPMYAEGSEGTFKFQSDGGTNYFGFARSDSYVLGCDTDTISVDSANKIVNLGYEVSMTGVPCIWYCPTLDVRPITWEQLNDPNGDPIPGASHVVSWEASAMTADHKVCHINAEDQKGFYRATIEMTGSSKFMTNMPADLSGGIICTNTNPSAVKKVGRCFPYTEDGVNVKWRYEEGAN